jgi:hypothetical protein
VAALACGDTTAQIDNEGGTSGEGGPGDDGGPIDDDSGIPLPKDPALAEGVTITQIAGFQTVKVPLMLNGNLGTQKAPLVAGKEAIIRIYFKLDAGWTPHNIVAVLTVTAGGNTTVVKDVLGPVMDSTEDVQISAFNLHLAPEQVTTDATYNVKIVDPNKSAPPTSDPAPQRFPKDGTDISLRAQSTGASLKLVLVPMKYTADGSGRLPDTSQAQLDKYKAVFYSMYPVPAIDITVHAAINAPVALAANGSGWNTTLQTLSNLRNQEGGADKYYYGIFEPTASFSTFCGGGCIAGLSLLAQQPTDSWAHAGIGLGYGGSQDGYDSGFTAAHEVGHQHGRNHAPTQCGQISGVDPYYPYAGGATNTYGWSLMDTGYFPAGTLIGLKQQSYTVTDIMGYCPLKWISDYQYKALYDRVKSVNGATIIPGPTKSYHWAMVDEHGTIVSNGPSFTGNTPPGGEQKTIGRTTGWFYPYDHIGGGQLLVAD